MSDCKLYRIEKKIVYSSYIKFELSQNWVRYSDDERMIIFCANSYPFNTYQTGDWLEIDNDKTCYEKQTNVFYNSDAVRKIFSSTMVPSSSTVMTIGSTTITRQQSLAVARELDAMVEQSGGINEYTAHIEVQDERGKPIKFSLSSKRSNSY